MCDRDHLPVGTYGGTPVIVCDDVPRSLTGYPLPDVDLVLEWAKDDE